MHIHVQVSILWDVYTKPVEPTECCLVRTGRGRARGARCPRRRQRLPDALPPPCHTLHHVVGVGTAPGLVACPVPALQAVPGGIRRRGRPRCLESPSQNAAHRNEPLGRYPHGTTSSQCLCQLSVSNVELAASRHVASLMVSTKRRQMRPGNVLAWCFLVRGVQLRLGLFNIGQELRHSGLGFRQPLAVLCEPHEMLVFTR